MDWKKSLQSFKELNVNFIFSKRIKTSFAQFCLFKINNNTYRLNMSTPNRNMFQLEKQNRHNAAHDYYHTVCPLTINKQTMDIIDFISEWQYMLDCANYRSKIHLLTNRNFTQLRTVTSETKSFFLESRWREHNKHNKDRSFSKAFSCSTRSQTPRLVQKQNNGSL